jgi:MFS family permease
LFGTDADVVTEKNFQILLLVSVLVPFGNGLLSPILDTLIDPYNASPASIGLMISMLWAPSIFIIPIVGVLADRYGRKPVMIPSLILYGVAGTAIAFATEFSIALLLRFIQGIGWAGLTALIVTSIGDFYGGSKEATAQGIRQTGTNLSGSAISLIAGVMGVIAWQYPFLFYALAIPVALAVFLWFDEPTGTHAAPVADGGGENQSYRAELWELTKKPRVLGILIARFLPIVVWIGFTTYNSIIVVRILGGTPAQAGLLYALGSLAVAVAASQAGRATAIFRSRYQVLLVMNALLGIGFVITVLASSLVVVTGGVIVMGIGFGMGLPLLRSLLTGFASESLRAGLVSLGSTGGRVTGFLTPIIMGGLIGLLTPELGFTLAVQVTGLGVSVLGGGGAIVCVLIARAASPV